MVAKPYKESHLFIGYEETGLMTGIMNKTMQAHLTRAYAQSKRAIMPIMLGALLSACGGAGNDGRDGVSQSSGNTLTDRATAAAPIVKMIRIDKDAYPTPPPRSDNTRIVGLLLPLSDERDTIRALAGHLYNGAQLALFDTPLNGGATNLVISLHDTKGTPTGAQEAAKAAIAAGSDVLSLIHI